MSEVKQSRIELHRTVQDFFREVVLAAMANQRVHAHALAVAYLSDVLADFARAEKLHDQETGLSDKPLAIQMCQALQSAPDTRISLLKKLGDLCLYVSGFFSDSLSRKLVDIDY